MLRRTLLTTALSLLLATPVLAQQATPTTQPDYDALFGDPELTTTRSAGVQDTPSGDYVTTSSIVDQGTKMLTYGKYLTKLANFARTRDLGEEVAAEIDQYAAQVTQLGQSLRQADRVRISTDDATKSIAASVFAIGKSLRLIGENLRGSTGDSKAADGMLQIGQSMVTAAQNLRQVAERARKNGGNVDLAAYRRQLSAVEWLLTATGSLDTSMRLGSSVQARITSSVSAERGRTYQLISFSGMDSVDARGTIGRNNYFWDFGDGDFQTGAFVTHPFSQANSYVVHLFVLGDSGFGMDSTTIKIEPVKPVAVISTDQESLVGPHDDTLSVVQGQSLLFSAQDSFDPSDPTRVFEYRWDFDDGTTEDVRSPTVYHAFPDARDYNVVLTVSTKEGLSSVTFKLVHVQPTPPTPRFTIQKEGDSVRADAAKDIFVDHAAGQSRLTFNAGRSQGAPSGPEGKPSRILSASWDFGDQTSTVQQSERDLSANQPVRHTYEKPGRYDVTLKIVDDQKSVATLTKTVLLLEASVPTADFSSDAGSDLTTHRQITFDASSSRSSYAPIISYSWALRRVKEEDAKTGSGRVFQASFDSPGSYEVTLQTKDANGTESPPVTQRYQVLSSPPRAGFTFRRSTLEPNVFEFDASPSSDPDGDALTYSWDFNGDGTYDELKLTSPSISHLFDVVGSAPVTLRVTDGFNRSTTATRTVQVDSTLVVRAAVEAPSSQAGPSPLRVNLVGSAYINLADGHDENNVRRLAWDFGDGTTSSAETTDGSSRVSHTFVATSGQRTFTVTLTATDATGARRRTSLLVVVGQPGDVVPVITVSPELPVQGTTATEYVFSAVGSASAKGLQTGLSAHWDFGDGTPLVDGMTVKHRYAHAGGRTVTLTLTDETSGKIGRSTRSIEVLREPVSATFYAGPREGSAPLDVSFDASTSRDPEGAVRSYVWAFGDGKVTQNPTATVRHTYATAGTYTVRLTVIASDGSKVDSEPATITVR